LREKGGFPVDRPRGEGITDLGPIWETLRTPDPRAV
jgi:hypothetical protein